MKPLNQSLQHAMRLMQSGDLHAATRAIQEGLGAGVSPAARTEDRVNRPESCVAPDCIDVEFRVVDRDDKANTYDSPSTEYPVAKGEFRSHRFIADVGELDYKLYVPADLDTIQAPLLLMLHGCTQSVDDFARGTRMNSLADTHGYVIAYPEQAASNNPNRCWNWFRTFDQQRNSGEPALLAALTRRLIASHRLDERRVHVAGLSAGGAMAAVLANTHPDLYAAIGVHSGIPIGLANDVPSAFAAMRSGGTRRNAEVRSSAARPVPAIVFHGDKDTTVHPINGHGVIAQSLANNGVEETPMKDTRVEHDIAGGGRRYTRTVHTLRDGPVAAEHWVIEGAGHAWSGGDAAGSFTDPNGPDASAQMLRFFSACTQ